MPDVPSCPVCRPQDAKDGATMAKAGIARLQQRMTERLNAMEALTTKYQQVQHQRGQKHGALHATARDGRGHMHEMI